MSVKIIVIEADNMQTAMAALRAALGDPSSSLAIVDPVRPTLPPKVTAIMEEVCRAYDVQPEQLLSPSREAHFTLPRFIISYLCRQWTNLSLKSIGRCMNRDHTSIIFGDNKVQEKILDDSDFAAKLATIESALAKRGLNPVDTSAPLEVVPTPSQEAAR